MGLFKKKADPITDRARILSSEIEALEAEIKRLDARLQQPQQPDVQFHAPKKGKPAEPVFEDFSQDRLKKQEAGGPPPSTGTSDLKTRRNNLAGMVHRLQNEFRGPTSSNAKLISYLAAGSIHGLRPLRYEKRVARNRFIALTVIFLLLLWGIIAVFLKR